MIFVPKRQHHRCVIEECRAFVPNRFGVVSWNVYKSNLTDKRFARYIEEKQTRYPIDFLLMQEAQIDETSPCSIRRFGYEASANIRYKRRHYGVMSASRIAPFASEAYLTSQAEMLFATRKSLLLTHYRTQNGKTLDIVNVHAINFRENSAYRYEKRRLLHKLKHLDGAMIVAGDFNTWNKTRYTTLVETMQTLGLTLLTPSEKVKRVFGYPIDFIFYRGLTPLRSDVWDDHRLSDHHPLYAEFEFET